MRVADLFDPDEVEREIATGYVRCQEHPDLPLFIYNYTQKCQYENRWNDVTRLCRGLVVDATGDVVARPFPKFFNLGQEGATMGAGRFRAYDKLDGSLGILYPTPDGHAVVTRGSFTSDQALHATDVWRDRYEGRVRVPDGVTLLFEIIYPANRVVVDYGDMDDLVLLAGIDNTTGRDVASDLRDLASQVLWPRRVAEEFMLDGIDQVRTDVQGDWVDEGFVLVWDDGSRVKVKSDEYLRLHRLVTGLNHRRIWEHLKDGRAIDEVLGAVPDEFFDWARNAADGILSDYHELVYRARAAVPRAAEFPDRKALAEHVLRLEHPLPGLVFALVDGKNVEDKIWRLVRPAGSAPWKPTSEDAA